MTKEEYFGDWMQVIDEVALNDILNIVGHQYQMGKPICPKQQDVFRAFRLTPYKELRAVFLFQDPYPQKDVATGIAVGNRKDTPESKLSPSLRVVKESVVNYEIPHNLVIFDNSLEDWATQGILMLNTALTVEMNKIGSHTGIWRPFISKLLKNISYNCSGIVFALFGKQAQGFSSCIDSKLNFILYENHPAYYVRTHTKMPDTIFTATSNILKGISGEGITWYKEELQYDQEDE